MKSQNLIILCIWAFIFLSLILLTLVDYGLSFVGYMVFLITGFVLSILTYSLPSKQ